MFCNIKYFLCSSIICISLHYRYVFPGPNQSKINFFEHNTGYYKVQQYSGRSQQLGNPVQSRPGSIIFSEFLGPGWADLAMASQQCSARLVLPQCTVLAQLPQQTQGSEQHPLLRLPWQDWAGGLQEKLCERKQEVGHQHWQPQCVKKDCLVNIPSVPRTIVWYSKILPVGTL